MGRARPQAPAADPPTSRSQVQGAGQRTSAGLGSKERPAAAGRPLPGVELRIEASGRPGRADEIGEIVVRGPMVFTGYAGLPDETARVLRDGWLRTGDLGALDGDGYLTVVDRRDDLFVSGGENVYPAEVEAVLLAHPAVVEAAVVGYPDPHWGAVPVAAVVLGPGATASDDVLATHCRTGWWPSRSRWPSTAWPPRPGHPPASSSGARSAR